MEKSKIKTTSKTYGNLDYVRLCTNQLNWMKDDNDDTKTHCKKWVNLRTKLSEGKSFVGATLRHNIRMKSAVFLHMNATTFMFVDVCVFVCGKVSSVRAFPLRTLNIYLGFVCLWSAAAAALCAHIAPNWIQCARRFCVAIDFIAICVMWTWYHNASAEDTKVNKLQFQIKIHREINVNEKKIENQEHVLLSHTIRIPLCFNWKDTHFELRHSARRHKMKKNWKNRKKI